MLKIDSVPSCPGIYLITNPAGKIYIGQATNLRRRLNDYRGLKRNQSTLIFNSIKRYGFENHKCKILTTCSISQLNNLERDYIKFYNSSDKEVGLNLTDGGQDYFQHSKETKVKMSLAQTGNQKALGRKQSKEEIEKRVLKLRGQTRKFEAKQKISKALIGKKKTPEAVINISKGNIGKNSKRVINLLTGEIFSSAKIASERLGYKKSTLVAILNGQNPNNTTLKYL